MLYAVCLLRLLPVRPAAGKLKKPVGAFKSQSPEVVAAAAVPVSDVDVDCSLVIRDDIIWHI